MQGLYEVFPDILVQFEDFSSEHVWKRYNGIYERAW